MIGLKMRGIGNKEIAAILGVTPNNVSDVLNSTIAKRQLQLLQDAANVETVGLRLRLERGAHLSLDLLEDVRDGKGEGEGAALPLRSQVAQDLLDRHPQTSKKVEQHSTVVPATPEIIAEAVIRAAQSRKLKAEDAEFEEIPEEASSPPLLEQAEGG